MKGYDHMKKFLVFNLFVIFVIIIFIWSIPIINNEIKTVKYGDEFYDSYKQSNMINSIKSYKVLEYSDSKSKVYYISVYNKSESGFVFHFEKSGEKWSMIGYDCIWSETGSAESFIWPYFYHSPEGLIYFMIIVIGCLVATILITLILYIFKSKWEHNFWLLCS